MSTNPISNRPSQSGLQQARNRNAQKKRSITTPKVAGVDIFKVILDADAGADSSRKAIEFYVKRLSAAQVSLLQRRIQRIRDAILGEDSDDAEPQRDAWEYFIDALEERKQRCKIQQKLLEKRIATRIKALDAKPTSHTSPQEMTIAVAHQRYSLAEFVEQFFSAEISRVAELLECGLLLRPSQQAGPRALIRKCLRKLFAQ